MILIGQAFAHFGQTYMHVQRPAVISRSDPLYIYSTGGIWCSRKLLWTPIISPGGGGGGRLPYIWVGDARRPLVPFRGL